MADPILEDFERLCRKITAASVIGQINPDKQDYVVVRFVKKRSKLPSIGTAKTLEEAVVELRRLHSLVDILLEQRDALQARVKELEKDL